MERKRTTALSAALVLCAGVIAARGQAPSAVVKESQPAPSDLHQALRDLGEVRIRPDVTAAPRVAPAPVRTPLNYEQEFLLKRQQRELGEIHALPAEEAGTDTEAGGREGGETCAAALVIGALPFTDTGNTVDNVNDYVSSECGAPTHTARDVVYRYTPPANQIISINMCGTVAGRDPLIIVFQNDCTAGSEIACNDDSDDGCSEITPPRFANAEIPALAVTAGVPYFIVVDGAGASNGSYQIIVDVVDNGACCSVVGGQTCQSNVSILDCTCLAEVFTEAGNCTSPICQADPVGANCPPNTLFGPGFHDEDETATFFILTADDSNGTYVTDAFWNVTQNMRYVSWWGVYALTPGLGGECDKPDDFTLTFYADDCGEPGAVTAGPFNITPLREDSGFVFGDPPVTSAIFRFTAPLPSELSINTAWVGISSAVDAVNPTCTGRVLAYGNPGTAAGMTGDRSSRQFFDGELFTVPGDMLMCVSAPNPGACCHKSGSCNDAVEFLDCDALGDRHLAAETCASVAPCPGAPLGPLCDGQLFGTGWANFENMGNWGSPPAQFADQASSAGGVNSIIQEGFWGVTDPIGAVTFWGWDIQFDFNVNAYTSDCAKADVFSITFYHDDNGAPGFVAAGPYVVPATRDATGWIVTFGAGFSSAINSWIAALPEPVCLKSGWVSVQGVDDAANPNCFFFWLTTDLSTIASGRDDAVVYDNGTQVRGSGMTLCLAPGDPVNGACCNDATSGCQENISCDLCPEGSRFAANTACAALVPECGEGACCFVNGNCQNLTQGQCTGQGGTSFTAGFACSTDPGSPAGVHCPPANDNCNLVTPSIPPYSTTGRNDGATDAGCAGLGSVVWEAFTTSACTDLSIDFCGTDPAFRRNPSVRLLPGCCTLEGDVQADSFSFTARTASCCIDDPPGYEGNVAIFFDSLPAGTWYYPVLSLPGSTGNYTFNVSVAPCDIDSSAEDCNANGTHDVTDIQVHGVADCNSNFRPDLCEFGDDDLNGRTDLTDYSAFHACISGDTPVAECGCLINADGDADVDLADYAKFQAARTACVDCTGTAEGEANCSTLNPGCDSPAPAFSAITCGTTVCGTSGDGDTDWFQFTVAANTTVTWTVNAEFPATVSILDGTLGCQEDIAGLTLHSADADACGTAVATACVRPGTYWARVAAQAGVDVSCGSEYRATLTCAAGCTPPPTGACCRSGGTCTANVAQTTCEAALGRYQGDGSACPCPVGFPTAGDECLTINASRTIPTSAGPNISGSITFNRSQISVNPNDTLSNCELNAGGPFAKDGSIWFRWRSGGAITPQRLRLDLCCQGGGPVRDSLIVMYPARPAGENNNLAVACPAITALGDGGELACDDDSCPDAVSGVGGAVLCRAQTAEGIIANRDYYIRVDIFDTGQPDEPEVFVLNYSSVNCDLPASSGVSCPGGSLAENEQTEPNYCGVDYVDTYNAGCNSTPESFDVSIACGDTICGSAGYYNTTGGSATDRRRDTDWYLVTFTEETSVTWTVNSATDGAHALLINVDDCDNTVIIDSDDDLNENNDPDTGCGPVVVSATVPAGRYAMFASFLDPAPAGGVGSSNEAINCPASYVATLECERPDMLAAPHNACASAPSITGAGRYAGLIGSPLVQTADGESSCDGDLGDTGFCDGPAQRDVYWNYTAPCTGRVTFEIQGGSAPMALSAHSGCPATCDNELPGGFGLSCSTFGGGPGGTLPRLTLDVRAGVSYRIRLAVGDNDGPFDLVVSDCVGCCDPLPSPDCPVCGNGELEGAEECDDGDNTGGDGCDAFCRIE